MSRIKIKNIGPIVDVEMELNKVNVIMGPQSSGKSTIAKLISYCQWVEKRRMLDNRFEYDVWEQLVYFHRLDENYFHEDSSFEYNSDFITVIYKGKDLEEDIRVKGEIFKYRRTKNIYIPAERSFVSVVQNLQRYREKYDNIFELLSDWSIAKSNFVKENPFSILEFGISYYFDKEEKKDKLILHKEQKEIPFNASSSGLQSVIPMLVIFEHLTNYLYREIDIDKYRPNPIEYKSFIELYYNINPDIVQEDGKRVFDTNDENMMNLFRNRMSYHFTNFIIEEPEQNLFPATQRDLIYSIINKLQSVQEHSLIITTHSPYILYAINNCMLGGLVNLQLKGSEKDEFLRESFLSKKSWINPKLVSIWEIENGQIRSIQDKDNIIAKNYFDVKMTELIDEYDQILNYYKDEDER